MSLPGVIQPMPILSYWQPWASLHVAGFKLHETRNRLTRVRGLVAHHASKRLITDVDPELGELCDLAFGADWREPGVLPVGCVVSVSHLTSCHPTHHLVEGVAPLLPVISAADLLCGDYEPGRFGWRMERTRALTHPLPLLGGRGWFRWIPPEDLWSRLEPHVDPVQAPRNWDAHVEARRHAA